MTLLWDSFTAGPGQTAQLVTWTGRAHREGSWADCAGRARRVAGSLRARGVRPGDSVALVLENGVDALAALAGTWFAGATAVSLPTPARPFAAGDYRRQVAASCRASGAELLVVSERARALVEEPAASGPRVATHGELDGPDIADPEPPDPDAPALLQFSSGSTAAPRGCVLSGRALTRQLNMLAEALAIDPRRDRVASWLPLSHDMGLIGTALLPWYLGLPLCLSTPERFLTNPRSWLADCAGFGATLTATPPSALDVAARAARGRPPARRLSLRACIVGAEPIGYASLVRAEAAFGDSGLDMGVLAPAYGLAEATLALAVKPPGSPVATLDVDAAALAQHELASPAAGGEGTKLVSSGRPLNGVGIDVEGGGVGAIRFRSPSGASAFVGAGGVEPGDPSGWIDSGDLGFERDGELYVVGRLDDVLSVGGRNVYAQPLELALGDELPLRRGSAVLVDVPRDGERVLVLVAEPDGSAPDPHAVATAASRRVALQIGRGLDECVLVPRGALPKTASGKPQRFRCRQLASEPTAGEVEHVVLPRARP